MNVRKKQMKKIKATVEEVVAVQITEEEFVELASEECKKMFLDLSHTGAPNPLDLALPMMCAKFSGRLTARIFADNNDENEEREEN